MTRIVFFGTSEFAVPALEHLANDRAIEIVGVVTQPDRPVGRHAVLTPSPVKISATAHNLPLFQPEKLKDEAFQTWIRNVGPPCDVFIVVSYGKILPQWLLDLPKRGVLNIHGSLLPRWRGASPIHAAIAAGDTLTGVTIMQMDALLDHGPVLATMEEPIQNTDTSETLHDRLALHGATLLGATLPAYLEGTIMPQPQDDTVATTCSILTRDDGKLDFTSTAEILERRIRAFTPWPGVWMMLDGKRLKILAARVGARTDLHLAGERFTRHHTPCIAAGQGTVLELVSVQPEGKKPMTAEAFRSGFSQWDSQT